MQVAESPSRVAPTLGPLGHGDHVCLLDMGTPEETIASEVRAVLEAGACCVALVDRDLAERVLARLTEARVDAAEAIARGALRLELPGAEDKTSDGWVLAVRAAAVGAERAGFTGLSLVRGPSSASGEAQALVEARLDRTLQGLRASCLCLYARTPAAVQRSALRTHRLVALGTQLVPNVFHEPPEAVLGGEPAVGWMLDRLRAVREARLRLEDAVETRDAFLRNVSHRLKTPLTALKLHAHLLARRLDSIGSDDLRATVAVLDRQAGQLAEEISRLLDAAPPEPDRSARDPVAPATLHTIVATAPSPIYVKDLAGRYLFVNDQFVREAGRPREVILGGTDADLFGPAVAARFREEDLRALEQGSAIRVEHAFPYAGRMRHFLTLKFPVGDTEGRPFAVAGFSTDMTEGLEAQEALRRSEAQLRMALESGRMGTWEWEIQTGRVRWSSGLERIHGLAEGTFSGDFEGFKRDMHPDDLPRILEKIHETIAERRDHEIEYRILVQGQVRWVQGRGKLFLDAEGKPERMVGVCMDVTGRKLAEEEDRRRTELEQQMLAIVSHDLRNPLGAITLSAAQMLRGGALAPAQARATSRILAAAERAGRLIGDLLDFARARGTGGIPINPRPMALGAVVRQVVQEVQLANPDRRIDRDGEVEIEGTWDADRIAQLLANLLANAVQHSPPGARVRVLTRTENAEAVLAVFNEGPPIPAADRSRLFQPFQRGVDAGRADGTRSVGLGLFICSQIVAAHHGQLSVESVEGTGTIFTVRLPLS